MADYASLFSRYLRQNVTSTTCIRPRRLAPHDLDAGGPCIVVNELDRPVESSRDGSAVVNIIVGVDVYGTDVQTLRAAVRDVVSLLDRGQWTTASLPNVAGVWLTADATVEAATNNPLLLRRHLEFSVALLRADPTP